MLSPIDENFIAMERNRFFFGKLMGVANFEKEQNYHSNKHKLINRLSLGNGVIQGLAVTLDPDDPSLVSIQAGSALDAQGREVIVKQAFSVNPRQLTNNLGEAEGELVDDGEIELAIAYRELHLDPVPSLEPQCPEENKCEYSMVGESFRVIVRRPASEPVTVPADSFLQIASASPSTWHRRLSERISDPINVNENDLSIPIARLTLPMSAVSIDMHSVRKLVYSNQLLHELFIGLAIQLQALETGSLLSQFSGNAQSAPAGTALEEAIEVFVSDVDGNPIDDNLVQFDISMGNGSVSRRSDRSNQQGIARTRWTLGSEPGEQRLTVRAVGSNAFVVFTAESKES